MMEPESGQGLERPNETVNSVTGAGESGAVASESAGAAVSAAAMLANPKFRHLVRRRWLVSLVLSLLLFALYYGYILLIGYKRDILATRIGEYTTLGIPIGVGVIVLSWLLTVIYVVWANRSYDPQVQELKGQLKG
jgi:uncharacterized membrane protein (DUF485 family)